MGPPDLFCLNPAPSFGLRTFETSSRAPYVMSLNDPMSIPIRRAQIKDLEAITEIYNEAILTTTATFDTEPKSLVERKQWFEEHDEKFPILAAVVEGRVVGWASL